MKNNARAAAGLADRVLASLTLAPGASRRHPEARHREVHAAERARSDPFGGSAAAASSASTSGITWSGARGAGPHRLRAPVRAHDVPGIEARAGRFAFPSPRRRGATGINGTTDFDRTNYSRPCPSNQLELALWLESDRMGYLLETVDQAKLSNQQDVVRNERRQSDENPPYGIVEEAMYPGALSARGTRTTASSSARMPTFRRQSSKTSGILPAVLRAEQRDARDRRRHRQACDQEARSRSIRIAQARARRSAFERRRRHNYR